MTLSMVIPTFTIDELLERLALKAIDSYRYYVDQIIVVEDGGRYSPQLLAKADIYVYRHQNGSFTKAVNTGWKLAEGDFCAIVNSDTYHVEGDLKKLCISGKVTSPEITTQYIDRLAGPFFVVPKEIRDSRGLLMEEMITYCSDSEYDNRVSDIFQKVPEVKVFHYIATTVKASGRESKDAPGDKETYEKLKAEGRAR